MYKPLNEALADWKDELESLARQGTPVHTVGIEAIKGEGFFAYGKTQDGRILAGQHIGRCGMVEQLIRRLFEKDVDNAQLNDRLQQGIRSMPRILDDQGGLP